MALIPQHFMNAVVAIGNRDPTGEISWVASGFFYGRTRSRNEADGTTAYSTYLVTNKHVLQGLSSPVVRANPNGPEPAQELPLGFVDQSTGDALWVEHPDPEVDVVVTGVNLSALNALGLQLTFFPDNQSASLSTMRSLGMSEADSVFLLGFPMGLVGGPRSAVVVRSGVIAQLQSALDGAAKSFMADGYVFPGNSGGPVVTKPEAMAIQGTQAVGSAHLVGIVASYIPYLDVAISAQTGRNRVVFEENSGLSNIFPVDAIEQTVDAFEVRHPSQSTETEPTADAPSLDDD